MKPAHKLALVLSIFLSLLAGAGLIYTIIRGGSPNTSTPSLGGDDGAQPQAININLATQTTPNQNHYSANQINSSYQQASQLSTTSSSQPMVTEGIKQWQQEESNQSLVSRPPAAYFMSERCGLRQTLNVASNGPTVLGLEPDESLANFGEFPAHAAILRHIALGGDQFVCSAVLISNQWLATAAHCVQDHRPEEFKVRLGEWDVNRDDESYPFLESNIREIILNPNFRATGRISASDLALIRLEQPVDGQRMPHVAPACLPRPEEQSGYIGRADCWVAGWNKNVFSQPGANSRGVLKRAHMHVLSHAECQFILQNQTELGNSFQLHPNNICAIGERDKDACEGDGGAGLYCLDPQSQLIKAVGLVSWGVGCGQRGVPGVYVNLANFNSWIEYVVMSRGQLNMQAPIDGQLNKNESLISNHIISEPTHDKPDNVTFATSSHVQQEGSSVDTAFSVNNGTTSTTSAVPVITSEQTYDRVDNGTVVASKEQQVGQSMGQAVAANESSPATTSTTPVVIISEPTKDTAAVVNATLIATQEPQGGQSIGLMLANETFAIVSPEGP